MENTSVNREPKSAPSPAPSSTPPNITLLVPASETGPDREVTLTGAQQQALECLFDGGSVTSAATAAGVTRQTVNRWIRDSVDFRTVYEAWHREIHKSVKDRMAAIGDAAMDNITHAIRFSGDLHASKFVVNHLLAQKEK